MAYSAVALLAFFAAFHNADGVLGGDSMATASSSERTLVDEPMMMAPEPEFDLSTERGRLGGRTGFKFGTQTLYTQDRFDN